MGDVRGIETDRVNFEATINYLKKFKHLNAICFLAKPNNIRITAGFRYCFKELFSHFHKNSIENICFCFTNTRSNFNTLKNFSIHYKLIFKLNFKGTQYKPGDTLPALRAYLKEIENQSNITIPLLKENVFCFDNEAFRYICLSTNEQIIDTELVNRENYAKSWERSASVSNALINYIISSLKPLKTVDLILLNQVMQSQDAWAPMAVKSIEKRLNLMYTNQRKAKKNVYIDEIDEILDCCVNLTAQIRSNSATVFNDQFEALFEEFLRQETRNVMQSDSESNQLNVLNAQAILKNYKKDLALKTSQKINQAYFNENLNKLMILCEE
jgi:hypothetical protein